MNSKFIFLSKKIVMATSKGLVKNKNEDAVGICTFNKITRICICDGHWGVEAANLAKSKILHIKSFPTNKLEAINLVEKIQKQIFKKFGHKKMDPEQDFTPETSLLAMEISPTRHLRILSYGDCRLMISQNGKIKYRHEINKTWLGSFSFLRLRNRLPANKATLFKKIICKPNDLIWLFTDGVDECHYERPTISLKWLAKTESRGKKLETIVSGVFRQIEHFGAEDNASIAIIKC